MEQGIEIELDLDEAAQRQLAAYARVLGMTVEATAAQIVQVGIVQAYAEFYGTGSDEHRKAAKDLGVDIDV